MLTLSLSLSVHDVLSTDLGQPQSMDKKRSEGAAACGSVVGSSSSTGTYVSEGTMRERERERDHVSIMGGTV